MQMNKFIILANLSVFAIAVFAQKTPIEYGNIPIEDLEMIDYEQDPDANALVLGSYADIGFYRGSDGIMVQYDIHRRVKILNTEGYKEADTEIMYRSQKEKIQALTAHTINLENGTQQKYKVDKAEIFTNKISDQISSKKFTFPNLKEGSIIEYKYTLVSEYKTLLDTWYFQEAIPTRWSELRVRIPEKLSYTQIKTGTLPFEVNEKRSMTGDEWMAGTQYQFAIKDAPGLVEEKYITTMTDYRSKVDFQLSESYMSGYEQKILSTWELLEEELRINEKFGLQIKSKLKHGKLTNEVPILIEGIEDHKKIAETLFQYVGERIEWNGKYRMFANDNINKAFDKSQGNSAEINLGLLACLRKAGLEAYPVLISTRDHGACQPLYPIVSQFNHVIVAVKTKDGAFFMDAVSPERPYDMLSKNDLNRKGLLIAKGHTTWVEIEPDRAAYSRNIILNFKEEKVAAKVTTSYIGYYAHLQRMDYVEADEASYVQSVLGNDLDYTLEESKFGGHDKPAKRFTEEFDLALHEYDMADRIYLTPLLFAQETDNPFKLKERLYPVDIAYPFTQSNVVKINIPEGYVVAELPESVRMKIPDDSGSFNFFVEQKSKEVSILSKIKFSKTIYSPEEYFALKELYNKIIEKHAEQIVLKKQ